MKLLLLYIVSYLYVLLPNFCQTSGQAGYTPWVFQQQPQSLTVVGIYVGNYYLNPCPRFLRILTGKWIIANLPTHFLQLVSFSSPQHLSLPCKLNNYPPELRRFQSFMKTKLIPTEHTANEGPCMAVCSNLRKKKKKNSGYV